MEILAVLALVSKGIAVAEALLAAGQTAAPAFQAIKDLITGSSKPGGPTQEEMDVTEQTLDGLIADFNLPLSPAQPGDPDYKP